MNLSAGNYLVFVKMMNAVLHAYGIMTVTSYNASLTVLNNNQVGLAIDAYGETLTVTNNSSYSFDTYISIIKL